MRLFFTLFLIVYPALASGLEAFPTWAIAHSREGMSAKPPLEADAWIIFQRYELTYSGEGEYLRRQYRLVRVLTERGKEEAIFTLMGFGGKAGKVKKLMAWNLRPDNEVVTLESDDVVSVLGDRDASISTRVVTAAQLSRVIPGSLIAFESTEKVRLPQCPADLLFPLEANPVRRWELSVGIAPAWFKSAKGSKIRLDIRHFSPWIPNATITPDSIVATDLPALQKNVPLRPPDINVLPMVSVAFQDSAAEDRPALSTWDDYAQWIDRSYQLRYRPIRLVKGPGMNSGGALPEILTWMNRELLYKQVYLTPERGWIPEFSDEVLRRRYGDCKDLTSCFSGAALDAGYEPHPALARIVNGAMEMDPPVNPFLFNHVITALRLKSSLGFPAEIETKLGRFLLVDPTSRLTPFGSLPPAHRRGRVLICLPEGGQWVDIPNEAIEVQSLDITLKGVVDGSGTFEGEVRISEKGDTASLRSIAKFGGADGMKDQIIQLLGLTARADLKVLTQNYADQLDTAFEVRAKLRVPQSWTRSGGEYSLRHTGFPALLPSLPREGPARLYPLESQSNLRWTLVMEVDLPISVALVCENRQIDTPFRTAAWSAKVTGQHFTGTFVQTRRDARFDHVQMEEGLRQARKDRNQMNELLEDATSFKEIK